MEESVSPQRKRAGKIWFSTRAANLVPTVPQTIWLIINIEVPPTIMRRRQQTQ